MKSRNLILALVLVVVSFAAVGAQNPIVFVNMDEVTGADVDGYIDPASLPATLVIPVHFTNNTTARTAISNGFHFLGDATFTEVTAAWNPAYPWDWAMAFPLGCVPAACYPYFDQGIFKNDIDWGGGIVGWGFAGLTGAQGTGLPADFDGVAYTFTVTGVNGAVGETLVMDSTWWDPANFWLWSGVAANVDWGGGEEGYVFEIGTHDVAFQNGAGVPSSFALNQNYPNPFNPTTTLSFDVPRRANVKIVVYNILGQPVRTLVDEELAAGSYTADWDGNTEAGTPVSSGVYLCHMQAGDFTGKMKMMMLK